MKLPTWAWALGAYWFLTKDDKPKATSSTNGKTGRARPGKTKPAAPIAMAYLYQLPADGEETVRVAFGPPGREPREMGIFGSRAKAEEIARGKGWRFAWDGVRQLATVPRARPS